MRWHVAVGKVHAYLLSAGAQSLLEAEVKIAKVGSIGLGWAKWVLHDAPRSEVLRATMAEYLVRHSEQ